MGNIVELRQVRKSYGEGTPVVTEVLHGIDLAIAEGEFAALTGPSGSGKSTLLNIIGLLEHASSGQLRINGQDTAQLGDAAITALRGRSIGFIFQFHHLLPGFSALENVMMPAIIDSGWPSTQAQDKAMQLLTQVGLKGAAHKRPAQLSGGMQQRVAIARALSLSPRADPGRRAHRQPRHAQRRRGVRIAAEHQPRTPISLPDRDPRCRSGGALPAPSPDGGRAVAAWRMTLVNTQCLQFEDHFFTLQVT
jgi:lipoprotein-releasing system ATP-binding protein